MEVKDKYKDVDIQEIDTEQKIVYFTDGTSITPDDFYVKFKEHFSKRIAGETIMPLDMERFMARSSSKNLKQLVDGKKAEGFEEGRLGENILTRHPIAIATIVTLVIVLMIVLVVLKNMGFLG